jgi:hypothetical protein
MATESKSSIPATTQSPAENANINSQRLPVTPEDVVAVTKQMSRICEQSGEPLTPSGQHYFATLKAPDLIGDDSRFDQLVAIMNAPNPIPPTEGAALKPFCRTINMAKPK